MAGKLSWILQRAAEAQEAIKPHEEYLLELFNRTGYKFQFKPVIRTFFPDFVCHELRLIVEVKTPWHSRAENVARVNKRTKALRALGFRVFWVDLQKVFSKPFDVVDMVMHQYWQLEGQSPAPRRAPTMPLDRRWGVKAK